MRALLPYTKRIGAALLIGGAALYSFSGSSASEANDDAHAAIEEAAKLRDSNDLRAARQAAGRAIEADPDWPMGHIARAEISLSLFDAVTAKAELEKALALGAPREELNHLIGEALWLLGEYELAEKTLLRPGLSSARQTHAYRILARLYMDTGQLDKAGPALDAALENEADNSMVWTDIGRFRLVAGDQKGAREAVDKAISLQANNVRALTLRGRMTRDQIGMVAALQWFERALAIRPDDVPALEEYAATLGEVGRYRDMLEQARRIVALDRKNGRAYYLQAAIATRAGEYALASRILQLAGSSINDLPGAILMAGIAEYQTGNINKSIDLFKRLVDKQPHNVRVRRLLAMALYRSGDAESALEEIRPLASRRDAESYTLKVAGRAFEANGNRARAAGGLDAAAWPQLIEKMALMDSVSDLSISESARRNPDDARFVIPHIRALIRQDNLEEALALAQRLRAKNPGVANAHLIEGDVHKKRNALIAATTAYRRAAQISFTEPVMLRLAEIFRRTGDGKAQRDLIGAFLENNPASLSALRLAGYYHIDDGNFDKAIPPLEYVLWRTGYNDSVLLTNLARAWAGSGNLEKAASYAAIAYRIDPANPVVTKFYGRIMLQLNTRPKAAYELLQKAAILLPEDTSVAEDLAAAQIAFERSAQ